MADLDHVFVMGSIHRVLKAEKALRAAGIAVDTLVTPREISADCGMVVIVPSPSRAKALAVLAAAQASPREEWRAAGGGYARVADSGDAQGGRTP